MGYASAGDMDDTPGLFTAEVNANSETESDKYQESYLALEDKEEFLYISQFPPPPPLPPILKNIQIDFDDLSSCNACTWARQNVDVITSKNYLVENSSFLGWILTLVVVSLMSALVGAAIMIVVLRLRRRLKRAHLNGQSCQNASNNQTIRPPINIPSDKPVINAITPANFPNVCNSNNGVWSWLSRRSGTDPIQLVNFPCSQVENHYTHMEDGTYNDEALYAELDRESTTDRDIETGNSYQNSGYADPDAQISSAPSSAYYSDLSNTTNPDRAYEIVNSMPVPWDAGEKRHRLAAISENVNVPSEYI